MYRYNETLSSATISSRSSSFRAKPISAFARLVDTVLSWMDISRQRRHLLELDDRLLRDIGLSRVDVEAEAAKPFWRVNR